jgi:hypothetical protein
MSVQLAGAHPRDERNYKWSADVNGNARYTVHRTVYSASASFEGGGLPDHSFGKSCGSALRWDHVCDYGCPGEAFLAAYERGLDVWRAMIASWTSWRSLNTRSSPVRWALARRGVLRQAEAERQRGSPNTALLAY